MSTTFPKNLVQNIKKDINYQIKISPAVIKVPYTQDPNKIKMEKDVKGNEIYYVLYDGKWFEIVHEIHKEYKGEKTDLYLIRVDKKKYPKAYPFNSFGYFVLPPELEAVYGKRCKILTDVCFLSNRIEEIFVNDKHVKFESNGISCIGDGEKANRYNPLTQVWDKGIPCVCGFSRYYTDYTGNELATEVDIMESGLTAADSREIDRGGVKVAQVHVQGAWRDVLSRDGKLIKLKPFTDNKAPCDFNFEILFMVTSIPGMHLNKLHSTGIENFLRLKESVTNIQNILRGFGIMIATQPMKLVLRVVEKTNKTSGKRLYPQVSIEFANSIQELIRRNSKETYLEEGYTPPAPQLEQGEIDIETGEFTEYDEPSEDPIEETESSLKSEYEKLREEINIANGSPMYVSKHFEEKQITPADTEDFYTEALKILNELKLKTF